MARTRQPQGVVRINPLYDYGIAELSFQKTSLLDGSAWSTFGTAPTYDAGTSGLRVNSSAAFGGLYRTPRINCATAEQTQLFYGEAYSYTGNYAGLISCAKGDGSIGSLALQRDAGGTGWNLYNENSLGALSGDPITNVGPVCVILSALGGRVYVYVNGVEWGNVAANASAQTTARIVTFGERAVSSSYATKGVCYLRGAWARGFPPSVLRELSRNPWQLFAPSRRVVVFGVGTGGGSTTYTPTVGGTLVFAGTPAYKRLIATITSGGVTYAGGATIKDIHKNSPSGGLTYAGSAAIKKLFKPLVAGGISFTGDAVEKLIRAALAAGGLTFGGTAGFTPVLSGGTIYTVTPTGGIVFGSSAAVKAIHQSLAAGGLAYSGEAGYNLIREIIASGGLSFAGAATVSGPVTQGTGTLDQATIDAIALAVWQRIIDAGLTAEELLRLVVAHAAGNATGLENGSPNFKSLDGTKNRITGTYVAGTRNVTGRDPS